MTNHPRTRDELENELNEQIESFRMAAENYDSGKKWAAKDLARSIYILFHDGTGRTKSLFGLLGAKKGLLMLTSKVVLGGEGGRKVIAASATPLLLTKVSSSPEQTEYLPTFDNHPYADRFKWVPFNKWWDEGVFHPLSSLNLSRKNIVFFMRTQDGGAHVDDHYRNEDYAKFSKDGDPLTRIVAGGVAFGTNIQDGKPIPNGMRATMRQIAWEVDQSLIKMGL